VINNRGRKLGSGEVYSLLADVPEARSMIIYNGEKVKGL
jgi:hypothetical protein